MCSGGKKMPAVKAPDPVVTDEDAEPGGRAVKSRDRARVAALYGERSTLATGALGLPGSAQTAGKKALGA